MKHINRIEFGHRRVSMILQSEAAECGLACLAMISNWFGYKVDMVTLRGRFSISLKGVSLIQLITWADNLQLGSRPIRLELEEIDKLTTPCILHWDLNHFVVLVKVEGQSAVIHDPAIGVRRLSLDTVNKHFTGVALELAPTQAFKASDQTSRMSLRALIGRVQGLWPSLLMLMAMAVALEAFALAMPIFNQWVVDEALVSYDRDLLNVMTIGFGLLVVVQTAISVARGWTVMYLSSHLNVQWIANVFTHLVRLPVGWFERRHLGDVVSRFGSIGAIQNTITTGFIEAILDGLLAVTTFAMMLLYNEQLAIIVLASVIFYAALRWVAYSPLREASEEALILNAKEQTCFLETVRGIQAIKLFGRELERRSRWQNLVIDALNREVRTQKFMLSFTLANTTLFATEKLLIFWIGAGMVMSNTLSIGMLFAFTAYAGQFGGRMGSLIDKYFEFRMLSLHAQRLADIVLTPIESDAQCDLSIEALPARVDLINVSFRHAEHEAWILRNLTLTIEPGESLAIVGPSGCGKTTLIKLLLGLISPVEGEVRYGGIPIKVLGHTAYRGTIAAVMQDDQLFAGSLAENISFFDAQPTQERIEECARLAAVHEEIIAMPMRYHTLSGDMGTTLSGGQKQRILLARALYKAPKILILDEATSHLDLERERLVNDAVSNLSITRICVAHRPETIAAADRVVQLANGRIESDTRLALTV
ncbi:MAG: peptidase domain-containing ABC transporter [Telluria sp.]